MAKTIGVAVTLLSGFSAIAFASEPPRSPYLAAGGPSATHDSSSAQQSSPNPGPTSNAGLQAQFLPTDSMGVALLSPPYPDGRRVIWMSSQGYVYKVSYGNGQLAVIDALSKDSPYGLPKGVSTLVADRFDALDREGRVRFVRDELDLQSRISANGVYALMSSENRLYFIEGGTNIVAYGDAEPNNPDSKIKRAARYSVPAERLGDRDRLFGMMMTHDGKIAFVTASGLVGIVDRNLDPATAQFVKIDGGPVSNSLCVDEHGGIYVVTEHKMHRVQWTGSELTTDPTKGAWSAIYASEGDQGGLRVGAGSGSTPSLMGGPDDPDKLVVITDGSKRMNLVAFWRDGIPVNWRGIKGADRRIAGVSPVTYGDPSLTETQSEQSVAVSGYGAFIVNNSLQKDLGLGHRLGVLFSGDPDIQPWGAERIDWDPKSDQLRSRWSRRDVSIPNTVPVISAASQVVYGVGAREGKWLLWGLDWQTGQTKVDFTLGTSSRWNSTYMITMPFPDGSVIYGGYWGLVRVGKAQN